MRKFLLTAVIALIGMSAWAAKPAEGAKGYLYNAAAGKFIAAQNGSNVAVLSNEKGKEFTVYFKHQQEKDGVISLYDDGVPADDFASRTDLDGSYYIRFKDGSNYLAFNAQPVGFVANYGQLIVKETEKGMLITHPYPNSSGPTWMKDPDLTGTYLQVIDGELTVAALDEANEGAYWQFVDQETYDKITGPIYPIFLTGGNAAVNVEVIAGTEDGPIAARFTPSSTIQNIFQIKNLDVSKFRQYGYKKIVVEFSGAAEDQFHAFAYNPYGDNQNPNWDIVTGMDNAPEWLAIGDSKYEVALVEDVIDDFTIFSWWSGANVTLTINACYFSKDELGAEEEEPEPEPEPEPAIFPAAGAQGYLYNAASGLFITGQAEVTLVAKADVTTGDIFNVWYKSDSENDGTNIRLSTSAAAPWTSLRYNEQKLVIGDDGYCKWKLAIADDGSFTLYYPSNYSAYGPEGYLTVDPEGKTFIAVAEPTEYSYWQFVDQETFDNMSTEIVATFDFNKSTHAVSNDGNDGDITETETLTEEGVTLEISPAEEGKTPNRYWSTKNGPQLRMYSGFMTLTAPEGKAIVAISINNGKWNEGNKFNGVASPTGEWAGNCSVVAIDIAANTQMNSITVTLADADEGTSNIPTEITSVTKKATQNVIFNISGQQLNSLQKGLNIVNGKKVYVK